MTASSFLKFSYFCLLISHPTKKRAFWNLPAQVSLFTQVKHFFIMVNGLLVYIEEMVNHIEMGISELCTTYSTTLHVLFMEHGSTTSTKYSYAIL